MNTLLVLVGPLGEADRIADKRTQDPRCVIPS
jgi:hypothetical protein